VDKEIHNSWLKKLNNMEDIEVRGSCAGHGKERPSYISFRMKDKKKDKNAKKVAKNLNKIRGVHAISEIGAQGRPRIVVATKNYAGKKGWKYWWKHLPDRISRSIKKVKK
jgi:hypothetical protein